MEREHIVYSLLLTLAGAVLAAPEPLLARLVRGCIALAFTTGVRAVAHVPMYVTTIASVTDNGVIFQKCTRQLVWRQ